MELFQLAESDIWGKQFASHARVGPVPLANPDEVCETCLLPAHRRRTGPLTIVWLPGSEVIPDFMFGFQNEFMVTEAAKAAFEKAGLTGYTTWPVKMKPPPDRKQRKLPIVPWPYTGPPFWAIHITSTVELLADGIAVRKTMPCPQCGRSACRPLGEPEEWNLVVNPATWDGSDFMCPNGLATVLLTERAAGVVMSNTFTNVIVRHVGRIGDSQTSGRPQESDHDRIARSM